jgi:hypothetical protein
MSGLGELGDQSAPDKTRSAGDKNARHDLPRPRLPFASMFPAFCIVVQWRRERLRPEAVVPSEPRRTAMKTLVCCSAVLVLLMVSASAQDKAPTIDPNELAANSKPKPPLQLSDAQRAKIQDALVTAHSAQKTPAKFEPKVGAKVPTPLKLDAMPAPLINQEPVLKQYDFVKLENVLLVVDPMNTTIVAVIPRKFPKEQAMQGSAPSGQTHDPASKGDEAETHKKD